MMLHEDNTFVLLLGALGFSALALARLGARRARRARVFAYKLRRQSGDSVISTSTAYQTYAADPRAAQEKQGYFSRSLRPCCDPETLEEIDHQDICFEIHRLPAKDDSSVRINETLLLTERGQLVLRAHVAWDKTDVDDGLYADNSTVLLHVTLAAGRFKGAKRVVIQIGNDSRKVRQCFVKY